MAHEMSETHLNLGYYYVFFIIARNKYFRLSGQDPEREGAWRGRLDQLIGIQHSIYAIARQPGSSKSVSWASIFWQCFPNSFKFELKKKVIKLSVSHDFVCICVFVVFIFQPKFQFI